MYTSSTATSLQQHYEQLYLSVKKGHLTQCFEEHVQIASRLRMTGAFLLAGRHSLYAQKIGKFLEVIYNQRSRDSLPRNFKSAYLIQDESVEKMEVKLITLLKDGNVVPQNDILSELFGSYAQDLFSEQVLSRVVDNINRHIARIIDVTPEGYCLKVK